MAAAVTSQKTEIKAHTARRSHWIMSPMIILVVLAFLAILASLGAALFFMMRWQGYPERRPPAWPGRWRGGWASPYCCLCILLAWKLGISSPRGCRPAADTAAAFSAASKRRLAAPLVACALDGHIQ